MIGDRDLYYKTYTCKCHTNNITITVDAISQCRSHSKGREPY